ncbi:TPA: ribulose-phosphate 3-epimerase [bacterium]|nr:ribulose-phosphate 3-epimerase [bacterium]
MIIVPALLTDNRETLIEMIRISESFTDYVQIDIMDGVFVPSRSVTASDLRGIETSLKMEAHLMVNSPHTYIDEFKEVGAFKIIFHFEATKEPEMVIEMIKESGLEVGLAINPETQLQQVEDLLGKVDSLLFLSVNPGFYGAEYIPGVLEKARVLRAARPHYRIGMDGGIKEDRLLEIKGAGVDIACVGSAILKAEDPKVAFLRLKKMINEDP